MVGRESISPKLLANLRARRKFMAAGKVPKILAYLVEVYNGRESMCPKFWLTQRVQGISWLAGKA
jgi:hypothetical protein